MRALITGITGQDGRYLADLLLGKGYEVFGLVHGHSSPREELVRRELPAVRLIAGDLTDLGSLMQALATSAPSEIYNLAAVSSVAFSWEQAALTAEVTAKGVLNLLEAIRIWTGSDPRRVRFYQASSSEMFGNSTEERQTERSCLRPRSPYGVSKVFAHHMTVNFRESYGMHASNGILFNHESPRRGDEFVSRKIARGVASIALGRDWELRLGNLDVRRDWGFAGDYVDAMWRMLQQPEPDDYVIGTGTTHSLRDFVREAFNHVGIDEFDSFVVQDPALFRPAEINVLTADPTKAANVLGWRPTVTFAELVSMLVDFELDRLRAGA